MELYNVVKKLVGEIKPIGETNIDNTRFENLKKMTELVARLVFDIDEIATGEKDSTAFSRKRAGKWADKFLDDLGITE